MTCPRCQAENPAGTRDPSDSSSAEDAFRAATALGVELGMRPLVAHCHLGLGRLYRRAGKRQPAQEHLALASAMYHEMDMPCWMARADGEVPPAAS